jgi:hypothetical protein
MSLRRREHASCSIPSDGILYTLRSNHAQRSTGDAVCPERNRWPRDLARAIDKWSARDAGCRWTGLRPAEGKSGRPLLHLRGAMRLRATRLADPTRFHRDERPDYRLHSYLNTGNGVLQNFPPPITPATGASPASVVARGRGAGCACRSLAMALGDGVLYQSSYNGASVAAMRSDGQPLGRRGRIPSQRSR